MLTRKTQTKVKLTIITFFVLLASITNAANYYVSTSTGDDSRSATQAQDPSTPWKTIAKVNSAFSVVNPGDAILFKRGENFYGRLVIGKSGGAGNPITIGAYGTGAQPIITSFITVNAWTNLGMNLWESTDVVSTKQYTNLVVINGNATPMGRFPNAGFLTMQSTSGNTSVTASGLPASPNWTGAEVVIKKERYILDRNLITNHTGNTIQYITASSYLPKPGWGMFIQNDVKTLDANNEWYYNPTTKKITVYSIGTPSNVKVPTYDSLLTVFSKDNIIITDLNFSGSNKKGVLISNCDNLTIKNCTIEFCYDGLVGENTLSLSTNFLLENNIIKNIGSNGCYFPTDFNGCVLRGNSFNNIGLVAGMGGSSDNTYLAIQMDLVNNSIIENNTLINIGGSGITFLGKNNLVTKNYLNNLCVAKGDAGAIYTYSADQQNDNSIISKNIIIDVKGNGEGAPGFPEAFGIFTDLFGTGVQILDNTVSGAGYGGIFLLNSKNITVRNNTSYGNKIAGIMVIDRIGYTSGMEITNNKFVATTAPTTVQPDPDGEIPYYSEINLNNNWGISDNNLFARPIQNTTLFLNRNTSGLYTLPQWRVLSGKEANSTTPGISIINPNDMRLVFNETSVSKTILLDGVYVDFGGIFYNGSITLPPNTSAVLIRTSNAVLPITLVSFSAVKQGAKTQLTWATSQEINSKNFIIERSTDNGVNWITITTVQANGNSSSLINYAFEDATPAKGVNLYRLKSVDIDNKFEYSVIRKVNFDSKYSYTLVPNPATDFIRINTDIPAALAGNIQVFNSIGQIVWQQQKQVATSTLQIDLGRMQKGNYTLKITQENGTVYSQQFIKR